MQLFTYRFVINEFLRGAIKLFFVTLSLCLVAVLIGILISGGIAPEFFWSNTVPGVTAIILLALVLYTVLYSLRT